MEQEMLFASFVLDAGQGMEIAIKAKHVAEATHIQGTIQKLPGGIDFLEGFMHLREEVIPVINLKKRMGIGDATYGTSAKVAVINHLNMRYGLLFEDIKEVFKANSEVIVPINPSFRSQDHVIAALVQPDPGKKAVELLDLNALLKNQTDTLNEEWNPNRGEDTPKSTSYTRYVIVRCADQTYGITIDLAKEITFCTEIDDMFSSGVIAGAIELRGKTIAVIHAKSLLSDVEDHEILFEEQSRILILSSGDCTMGLIVDEVRQILTVPDNEILPFPHKTNNNVTGVLPRSDGEDIILLDAYNLVCGHADTMKSISRLGNGKDKSIPEKEDKRESAETTQHLITENSYLVFDIDQKFAIELKDVKEIIENMNPMPVPGQKGNSTEVINLRGEIVPIVNLKKLYGFASYTDSKQGKLIIAKAHGQTIALAVDNIVTIYKQAQFFTTPSLSQQLRSKKDTLDRLIEYRHDECTTEHVLVLNIHNLIRNHLHFGNPGIDSSESHAQTNNNISEISDVRLGSCNVAPV